MLARHAGMDRDIIQALMAATAPSAPLVSVVIPTRNRLRLTQEAVGSLQAQSYANWEAVVVDDLSDPPIADQLRQAFAAEPRVRVLDREGPVGGAPVCRNQGYQATLGEFVVFLDSDDLLIAGALAQRVAVLTASPGLDCVVAPAELFEREPGDLRRWWNVLDHRDDLDRALLWDMTWQTASPLWRREALHRIGPWDEHAWCWQDWEFHVRALASGLHYVKLTDRDLFVRRDPSQLDRISIAEPSPRGFGERVRLYLRVYAKIRNAPRWREEYRAWFADAVWSTLVLWYRWADGAPADLAALWADAEASGLLTRQEARSGRIALAAMWVPPAFKVLCRLDRRRFAEFRHVGQSQTFLRAPVLESSVTAA